jgi:hypothetical protein
MRPEAMVLHWPVVVSVVSLRGRDVRDISAPGTRFQTTVLW